MFDDATTDNSITVWKTLTLSSLAHTAASLKPTLEQGPSAGLAQEFSEVVDRLHRLYAEEGDVDTTLLLTCSSLGAALKAWTGSSSEEDFQQECNALRRSMAS